MAIEKKKWFEVEIPAGVTINFLFSYPLPLLTTFICESVFLGYGATEDLTSDNIQVQPNPSNGNFEIKSEQSLGVIAIYDLAGKKILSFETNDNSCLIDLSTYPRGAYHMNITNKNESYHKQILVVE
jgi:hypothetical protein